MNLEQRVHFIRRNLDMGGYTMAARECVCIIETAFRELFLRHLTRLAEKDRIRVQQEELKIGKGKGIESFTMGQLVGLFRRSKFLDAWAKVSGRELINIRMINLNELTDNRNSLIHNGKEATRSEAEFLFYCLRMVLETFGIESLERELEPSDGLVTAPEATLVEGAIPPNPYRGLQAFREEDAGHFYGREAVVDNLLTVLETRRLITLIGASGSGKSSLVFAGLVPALRQAGDCLITPFRPRNQPFTELALALMPMLYPDKFDQVRQLKPLVRDLDGGVVEIPAIMELLRRDHPNKRLVVIADQFEELFTLNPDRALQERFIERLLQGTASPGFILLLTLRADFMGQALSHGGFARALNDGHKEILVQMDEADLMAAIEKPADQLGVSIEAGLAQRILQDVGHEPGSLPLLEFALTQLWDLQTHRQLAHSAYDEIGGVRQALSNHADTVLSRFSPEGQQRLRQVFIQLVRPGEGTEDTRQVAGREQFREENWDLITQVLANDRLVVTGRNEETGQETVEVVHEALIRNWQPLKDWMAEDRAFRVWQNNLRQAMALWVKADRDEGGLLRGVRLNEAEEKLQERREELGLDEIDFIEAGIAFREKEKREKAQVQKRIRRTVYAALLIVLLTVCGWAVREMMQRRNLARQSKMLEHSLMETQTAKEIAEEKEKEANQRLTEARHNLGRVFLEKANQYLEEKDFNKARLLAYHALINLDEGISSAETEKAQVITNSNRDYPVLFSSPVGLNHRKAISIVSFSPDGRIIASGSGDHTIRLWDVGTGEEKFVLKGHEGTVWSLSFSPDGRTLASGSHDETIRFWDVATGKEKTLFAGQLGFVFSLSFSPDGRTLASGSWDGTIRLWNVATGKEKTVLSGHDNVVRSLSFSPDGRTLASGSRDKTARLWDVETWKEKAVLWGHEDTVFSLSFSPDGRTLASGSRDKSIRFWDVETGNEKSVLRGHENDVRSVSFSPDGLTLASGAGDNTIRFWNVETGKEKSVLRGHTDAVSSVSFSPAGLTLASGSADKSIRLWNVETGKEKTVFRGHEFSVQTVSFSPDGRNLASGSYDKTVRLWDVETGKEKSVFKGHEDPVSSLSFSSDGQTLASASYDKTVRVWDVETGKEKAVLKGHEGPVSSLSFSSDSRTLASASDDNTIRLWDMETGKEKRVLRGHELYVLSLSFSPDGRTLASGSVDRSIRLWDVETGKEKAVLRRHEGAVNSVSFSPDARTLTSGSDDNTVRLWDVETGKEKAVLKGHAGDVNSVSFSPDGRTLTSGSNDNTVRLWDVKTGKEKAVISGHEDVVSSVSFSPDGRTLASGADDKTIRLWNVETKQSKAMLRIYDGAVSNVSFSPDGRTFASGASDKTIRLWDVETGKEKAVLKGHARSVSCVRFSPDGRTLASGSSDRSIRLWDLETGKEKIVLRGHEAGVYSVSFSPDGQTLASGSGEIHRNIRLWDVKTGKEKAVLKGHEDEINRVSFSPDGRTLVSGSQDWTTRLWDVETGREKAVLEGHSHSPSNFSPDGRTLALGARDIRLWNVETGKEKSALKGHESLVSSVSFSPDGRTLASASMDRTLRLLDVETGKEKAALTVFPGRVFGVSFSPDGRTLAWLGTLDKTIRLWDVSFLYDSRPIEEKIKEVEKMYNLKLENLTLQPIPPERNLYGANPQPPRWPKTHPFHWRSAAESGDAEAMIELGVIYDRDNELDKAWKWYTRALHAGSDRAEERIKVFKQWLALHKEEYPAAYEKYISNPDPLN